MTVTATKTIYSKGDRKVDNLELQRREICILLAIESVYIANGL